MQPWIYSVLGYMFLGVFGGIIGYGVWRFYQKLKRYVEEDWLLAKRLEKMRAQKVESQEWLHTQTLKKFDLAHVEFHEHDQGLIMHVQKALRRCGPDMSWLRFLLMLGGCSVVWMVVLWISKRAQGWNVIIVGTGFGVFTAYQWTLVIGQKRERAFLMLFPEVLETMIRTVRAGATIDRSIRIVGEKIREPFGSIFQKISQQIQVGVPMDYALKQTADTIMLDDFRFFAIVLAIQQETGGALADVLNKLAVLIRARQELRLKVHALTSESRTSAIIVGSLPVAFGAILQVLSPGHFAPFFQNPTGQTLFNSALGLLGFGFFVLWKMTQIKV